MQRSMCDNMSYIETCSIVIDTFYIGRNWALTDDIHYLEPQKHPLRRNKGTCNSAPLPYLADNGGTTATRWLSRRFCVKICFLRWTRQSIHNTLIIVNRYLRLMGDKTILDEAPSRIVLSPIHLPHQGVVDSYGPCWPMKQNSVCHLSVCHW